MTHKHLQSAKGFTLIETLVAITILMIAIAGPLTVANKAYTAALDARNQTVAYNLAQEALEYVNNVKDNQGDFTNLTDCLTATPCGVSAFENGTGPNAPFSGISSNISGCGSFNNCRLTLSPTDGYTYKTGGDHDASPFTRKFYMEDVSGGTSDQYLATVIVSWNTGSVSNLVTLKQLLTKEPRDLGI